MTELDKFKRRLIRSVARLLMHEKRPEDVVWEQLKKETGCDCKLLWERMRALALKKLDRLLAAEDKTQELALVARMSLTDWLLFDLVLVHEDVDLLGNNGKTEALPLWELFELVQRHGIETTPKEHLDQAWSALVLAYNTNDRQCSPMLLQKRWYQLKEATRRDFYTLWHSYRGNPRLWDKVKRLQPSLLQAAIAKKFPHVVTRPFPSWDEMVQQELVILPHRFEKLKKSVKPVTLDDKPDLEVIEPEIETIDLRMDSDSDDVNKDANINTESFNTIKIKQEPQEFDGLSNVQILSAIHVNEEDNNSNDRLSPTSIDCEKALRQQTLSAQMVNFMRCTESFLDPDCNVDVENPIVEPCDVDENDSSIYASDAMMVDAHDTVETDGNLEIDTVILDSTLEETDNTTDADSTALETGDTVQEKSAVLTTIAVEENVNEQPSEDSNETNVLINEKVDEFLKSKQKPPEISKSPQEQENVSSAVEIEDDDDDLIADDLIQAKADAFCKKNDLKHDENTKELTAEENELSAHPKTGEKIGEKGENVSLGSDEDDIIKAKFDEYLCAKSEFKTKDMAEESQVEVEKLNTILPQIDSSQIISDESDDEILIKLKFEKYLSENKTEPTAVKSVVEVTEANVEKQNVLEPQNNSSNIVSNESDEEEGKFLNQLKLDKYTNKNKSESSAGNNVIEDTEAVEDSDMIEPQDTSSKTISDESDGEDLIQLKFDEYLNTGPKPRLEIMKNVEEVEQKSTDEENCVDDIIKEKADDFIRKADMKKLVTNVVEEFKLPTDVDIVNEGIEFVDDGIEYFEDEEEEGLVNIEEEPDEIQDPVKFDLKLLMEPVVYTTKLDNMPLFTQKTLEDFSSVNSKQYIEEILSLSKPVSQKSINNRPRDNESKDIGEDKDICQDKVVDQDEHIGQDTDVDQDKEISQDKDINQEKIHDENLDNDVFEQEIEGEHLQQDTDEGSEEEEETISEEQKVKSTSYLLQKPRSRSYNPIQLCKNPDFNTRLKRLTAGFFCYTRNRQLLKACIPLTIDLNKAFESKLIDGTLYLKTPSVNESPIKVEKDDASKQATAVVPSAMPLQSLIDATVDALTPVTSSTSLSTVDLTSKSDDDILERNKVINLHDLSEIRRINQRLLTAEVSPIPLYSQAPTNEDLTEGGIEKNSHEFINAAPGNSGLRGHIDNEIHTSNNFESENSLLVETAGARGRGRGRGRGFRGRGRGTARAPGLEQRLEQLRTRGASRGATRGAQRGAWYQPSYNIINTRVEVPWNKPKPTTIPEKPDEFLITIDTLNKMINKMNGIDQFYQPTKKRLGKVWCLDKKIDEYYKEEEAEASEPPNAPDKEQITEAKETPPEPVPEPPPPPKVKQKAPKFNLLQFCCWCAEKLSKLDTKKRMRQKHPCVEICECCCAVKLGDALRARHSIKLTQYSHPRNHTQVNDSIVLSDDDEVPANKTQLCTPIFKVKPANKVSMSTQVSASDILKENSFEVNAVFGNIDSSSPIAGRGLLLTVGSVTSETGTKCAVPVVVGTSTNQLGVQADAQTLDCDDISEVLPSVPVSPLKTPPIERSSILAPKRFSRLYSNTRKPPTIVIKRDKIIPLETNRTLGHIYTYDKNSKALGSKRSKYVPIAPRGTKKYTIVPDSRTLNQMKANKDERVLLFPSRFIDDKPKESPIFVGKNKILLSTVRMPRDSPQSSPEKPIIRPEPIIEQIPVQPEINHPTIVPTLALPDGVELVALPDGTLTYTVNPGVVLTEEQLAVIPTILAAVYQQLASQMPQGALEQESPVITLDDDNTTIHSEARIQDAPLAGTKPPVISLDEENTTSTLQAEIQASTTASTEPPVISLGDDNTTQSKEANIQETPTERDISLDETTTSENKQDEVKNTSLSAHQDNFENQTETYDLTEDGDGAVSNEQEKINSAVSNEAEIQNQSAETIPKVPTNRNLLSDLMEMSGISADDTLPTIDPVPVQPTIIVSGENAVTNVSQSLASPQIMPVSPIISPSKTTTSITQPPELSPITSLKELRYACLNNASFFKLDLETGILIPINVAIKKSTKNLTPISVVDLTDDGDEQTDTAIKVTNVKNNILSYRVKSDVLSTFPDMAETNTSEGAKPLKLFRLRKLRSDDLVVKAKPNKRKQDHRQYRIDLDSEEPENETSKGENKKQNRRTKTITTEFVSDSSDDEPLAVVSKRMKEGNDKEPRTDELAEKPVENNSINSEVPVGQSQESLLKPRETESLLKPREPESLLKPREPESLLKPREPESLLKPREPEFIDTAAEEKSVPLRVSHDEDEGMEVDDDGMDIDDEVPADTYLEEVDDNSQDGDDDCILGV